MFYLIKYNLNDYYHENKIPEVLGIYLLTNDIPYSNFTNYSIDLEREKSVFRPFLYGYKSHSLLVYDDKFLSDGLTDKIAFVKHVSEFLVDYKKIDNRDKVINNLLESK